VHPSGLESSLLFITGVVSAVAALAWAAHFVSYQWIKRRTLEERRWDYNICCGTTDGGGINADIVEHANVPRFERVSDVTRLSHPDGAFDYVLCSHTIEHVPNPEAMYRELRRVGRKVTLLVPPLWDFTAALNPFEHQVIFLTLRSRHDDHLPPFIRFLPAQWIQRVMGQRINADPFAGRSIAPFRKAMDFAVPAAFLASAAFGLQGSRWAWAGLALALAAFWSGKR
jgi:hypothetical protein